MTPAKVNRYTCRRPLQPLDDRYDRYDRYTRLLFEPFLRFGLRLTLATDLRI